MSRAFGITGGMGAGKSTLAGQLARHRFCRIVEVDDLRRHALWVSDAPRHAAMRARLAAALGLTSEGSGHRLDRAALAARAFSGRDAFEAYAAATAPTLREDARAAIESAGTPPAAIVWTRLVEDGYLDLLDGPLGVVTCPDGIAAARVAAQAESLGDPLSSAEATARMALLGDDEARLAAARAADAHVIVVPSHPRLDPCAVYELLVHFTDLIP